MKQTTFPFSAGLSSRLRKATTGFLPVLLFSLGSQQVHAQFANQILHDFAADVKNYSLEIATDGAGVTEAVQAGTLYSIWKPVYQPGNQIHFMNTGPNGSTGSSVLLDNLSYEERVVDIVGNGLTSSATYYIIASARGVNDGIEIIPVDNMGTITGTPQTIMPTVPGENYYPLHSIWHSGANEMFICGYVTDNYTALPSNPSYAGYGHKKAFVLRYDPGSLSVKEFVTINTNYTTPPSSPGDEDFDIAMRLVEMSNGDIFVTGSVNANSIYPGGTSVYHSGVMNLRLDWNDLYRSNNPLVKAHFKFDVNESPVYPPDEYGVGIVEDVNPLNGYYVVANSFFREYPNTSSFSITPAFFSITSLDNAQNFYPAPNFSRYVFQSFDYSWGLQTLKACSTSTTGMTSGARFLIAGQTINDCQPGSVGGFMNNYRPFLLDATVSSGSTIGFTNNNYTTYMNALGTGASTNSNSYYALDRELNNGGWTPTFAGRLTDDEEIVLNAPHEQNTATGLLNNKTIIAEKCSLIDGASTCYSLTGGISSYSDVNTPICNNSHRTLYGSDDYCPTSNPCTTTVAQVSTSDYNLASTTLSNTTLAYVDWTCSAGDYKQGTTGVKTLAQRGDATSMYPNPASTEITFTLAKNIGANAMLEIRLIDIFGKVVGTLYKGNADKLNSKLQLPDVANGIYMVQMAVDGKVEFNHQLAIAK